MENGTQYAIAFFGGMLIANAAMRAVERHPQGMAGALRDVTVGGNARLENQVGKAVDVFVDVLGERARAEVTSFVGGPYNEPPRRQERTRYVVIPEDDVIDVEFEDV